MVHPSGGKAVVMSSDRFGRERTPSFEEVLRAAATQAVEGLHVAMPGLVVKYIPGPPAKADIQPLLKRTVIFRDASEESELLPVIPMVPIIGLRGGGFYVNLPLKPGDGVLLVVCERSIDNWVASSGKVPVDPVDLRKHDLSDAVAIPGLFPDLNPMKVPPINLANLTIGNDTGQFIAMNKAGQVNINNYFTVDP